MPIDLGQFKKKAEIKKEPEVKIISIPKKIERKEKKEIISAIKINDQTIDNKIKEVINERILELAKVGLKHELTIENVVRYIKTHRNKTKLYKLVDVFSESSPAEIDEIMKYLINTGVISKNRDGLFRLIEANK